MIRSRFFGKEYRQILPCVSSQSQPHDVVGPNTCLKMWDKGSKGEDCMTVNQELDCDGRAENRVNLSRTIRKIYTLFYFYHTHSRIRM